MPVMEDTQYEQVERNLDKLRDAYLDGESLNQLSARFKLRREAIATVFVKHEIIPSPEGRTALLQYIREHPAMSIDEISTTLEMTKSTVSRYLRGTPERLLVITRKNTDYTTYSDETKKAALREAWDMLTDAQRENGLSRVTYDRTVGNRADRPSSVTFIRRWSTWAKACEAAEIRAAKQLREDYDQEFTDDDIVDGIIRFTEETGSVVFHDYTEWARTAGAASGPLVIIRLGSWADARKAAILRAIETGAVERWK